MAVRILRRLGSSGAPSSLRSGQLARNENTGILYYGAGNDGSGNATSVVAIGWLPATAAQLMDNVADLVVSPAALHAAMAHSDVRTHSSSVTLDGTDTLTQRLGNITSSFSVDWSPAIPDGWTQELRAQVTSGGPHLMQFPTGSVLLGEAWTGTRQISLAASSAYLITVKRAKDNSGTGYYLVSYLKEGG